MTDDATGPDRSEGEPERLDLRGLKCPLPVMRTRRRLERARPGDVFLVETTDPMSAIDIPHLCRTEGHRLVATERNGSLLLFRIEAGSGPGGGATGDQPNVPVKPEM